MSAIIPTVTIVTPKSSPRLQYIVHHIFHYFLDGVPYQLITNPSKENGITINYGNDSKDPNAINLPAHEFLFRSDTTPLSLNIDKVNGLHKSMDVVGSDEMTFGFDLFAWLFFLISRYEEYNSQEVDEHGRYKSINSVAYLNGFLEKPLVDLWIQQLTNKIKQKYNVDLWPEGKGRIRPSIDIDMPFAYYKKGFRSYAGIFRDLLSGNTGGVLDRMVYYSKGKDPFDTYSILQDLLKDFEDVPVFLLQNYNPPHDLNHIVEDQEWKIIIGKLAKWARLGIHPSYRSHDSLSQLKNEKSKLEEEVGEVIHSRQHFLKFSSDTYHNLIEAGITHDHSMLYPDQVGFRASSSRPFLWYNLKNEQSTKLLIHPYAIMDVTLRYYLKLNPNEAIQKIDDLKIGLQKVNGDLGFLWHNSSMSRAYGWKKWLPVLHHLLKS